MKIQLRSSNLDGKSQRKRLCSKIPESAKRLHRRFSKLMRTSLFCNSSNKFKMGSIELKHRRSIRARIMDHAIKQSITYTKISKSALPKKMTPSMAGCLCKVRWQSLTIRLWEMIRVSTLTCNTTASRAEISNVKSPPKWLDMVKTHLTWILGNLWASMLMVATKELSILPMYWMNSNTQWKLI